MKTENVIDNIINIPAKFHYLGNVSFYSLLKETGYFDLFDQINEKQIKVQLIKHPEWIEQWLHYSDDKRVSSGWFLTKNGSQKYVVGYYPPEKFKTLEFSDSKEACSVFIKFEIEEIRNLVI